MDYLKWVEEIQTKIPGLKFGDLMIGFTSRDAFVKVKLDAIEFDESVPIGPNLDEFMESVENYLKAHLRHKIMFHSDMQQICQDLLDTLEKEEFKDGPNTREARTIPR